MLKAQLIVLLLVGALVGGYHLSDQGTLTSTEEQSRTLDSRVFVQDTNGVDHDTTRSAIRSLPHLNPYARNHDGFLGFIRLEPKMTLPEPVVIPQPVYTDETDIDDIPDLGIASYALEEGNDTGVFLPELVDIPPHQFVDESAKQDTTLFSRPVMVIHKIQPDVPPVAEMNEKEGYVEILMLVDKQGNPGNFFCRTPTDEDVAGPVLELTVVLKNNSHATLQFFINDHDNTLRYVIIEERPKDYYFADYLLKVLPQWRFAPAIKDGQPVESFVLVQYHFCRSDDENCKEFFLKTYSP